MRKIERVLQLSSIVLALALFIVAFMPKVLAADLNPAMGTSSQYTLTQVTPADTSNLPANVFKYRDGDTVKYYRVDFKNSSIGTGPEVKYFKWGSGHNGTLVECSQSESVIAIHYDSNAPVESTLVPRDTSMDYVNSIYLGQSIKKQIAVVGTLNSVQSQFVGNKIDVVPTDSYDYSAVTAEADGQIGEIKSSFIGNNINIDHTNNIYGPMVKSLNKIDKLESEFIGNNVTTNTNVYGGAVHVAGSASIETVKSDFVNNAVTATGSANINGGVLANEGIRSSGSDGHIGVVQDSSFVNNSAKADSGNVSGGAVYNTGTIDQGFKNSVFTGNSAESNSGNAYGGAIANSSQANVVNSQFTDNYAQSSSGEAKGGAVYTTTSMTVEANNGGSTVFSGNYVVNGGTKVNQAIYVDNNNATLTVNAKENGTVKFDDAVAGQEGYSVKLTGDNTGKIILNNDITNAKVSADNVNISLADNNIKQQTWVSLASDESAKWTLDADFANKTIDSFNVGDASSGVITIDNLNFLSSVTPTETTLFRVIYGDSDNISITLSDAIIAQFNKSTTGEQYNETETIKLDSMWDDTYSYNVARDDVTQGVRLAKSDESKQSNDSIEYFYESEHVILSQESQGDTLRLLNEMEGDARSFTANSADQTYTVKEDLGSTGAGGMTVTGKVDEYEGHISTLDAGNHTLFKLDKDNAELTVKDVNIVSANTTDGAVINATNSTATVNIAATEHYAPTEQLGEIVVSVDSAATNGIINNGTLNVTDDNTVLNVNTGIKGTGTTNVKGGTVNMGSGNNVEQGAVNLDGGSLHLSDTSTIKADDISVKADTSLSAVATNILSDVTLTNGYTELRGGTLSHAISNAAGADSGYALINGDVTLAKDAGYVPNVRFSPNSNLTAWADSITGDVQSTGLYLDEYGTVSMTLLGGTLNKGINFNKDFVVNIDGDVTFASPTANSIKATVVIDSGKSLTTGAALSNTDAVVQNAGTLNVYGDGTTTNSVPNISGSGTTNITGGTVSEVNGIDQGSIHIDEGARLNVYAKSIHANELTNDGTLYLTELSSDYKVNAFSSETLGVSEIHGSVIGTDPETGAPIYSDTGNIIIGQALVNKDVLLSQPMSIINSKRFRTPTEYVNNTVAISAGSYLFLTTTGTLDNDITGDGSGYGYLHIEGSSGMLVTLDDANHVYSNLSMYKSKFRGSADNIHRYISVGTSSTLYLTSGELNLNGFSVSGKGLLYIDPDQEVTINAPVTLSDRVGASLFVNKNAKLTMSADNLRTNASVNAQGAELYLTDGTMQGQVLGPTYGTLHIAGDVTDEEKLITANIVVDDGAKFTANADMLKNSRGDITNNGTILTEGTLNKNINSSGTTIINENGLTMKDGVHNEGTLNLNDNSLTIVGRENDFTKSNYEIGKATGEGSLTLDLDAHIEAPDIPSERASTLTLGAASDATFNIDKVNVSAKYGDMQTHPTGIVQILYGDFANGASQLVMSGTKNFVYNYIEETVVGSFGPNVYYDDFYGLRSDDVTIEGYYGVATTAKTNDSIEYTIANETYVNGSTERNDLLADWNIEPFTEDKTFSFRTANDEYKSLRDVGSSQGAKLSVIGVAAEENHFNPAPDEISPREFVQTQKSVIDLDGHSGFIVNDSNNFNISDVTIKNASVVIPAGEPALSSAAIYIGANSSSGSIDADHNVTGGIVNTDFINNRFESEVTSTRSDGIVRIMGKVSQIKDAYFKDNYISLVNGDDANYNPFLYGGVLSVSGASAKVGQSYTDDATGEVVRVGGIIGSVFENNSGKMLNYRSDVDSYNGVSALLVYDNGANISQIKDSQFLYNVGASGNQDVTNNTLRGAALSVINAQVGTIENTDFIGNSLRMTEYTVDEETGEVTEALAGSAVGAAIYLAYPGSSSSSARINLIKDSLFMDNSVEAATAYGGAIAIVNVGSLLGQIDNTKFINNHATSGGAIYVSSGLVLDKITNSYFEGNTSNARGGAIYLYYPGKINEISGSTFVNNYSGSYGGAIYGSDSSSTQYVSIYSIKDTLFEGNNAKNHGGAIGLSIIYNQSGRTTDWSNVTFNNNYITNSYTSALVGGAVWFSGGGILNTLVDSSFTGNYVLNTNKGNVLGGGLYSTGKNFGTIDGLTFDSNYVKNTSSGNADGGGAYFTSGSANRSIAEISNTTFTGNYAEGNSGAVYGGAMFISNNSGYTMTVGKMENLTFTGNYIRSASGAASYGGAMYLTAGTVVTDGIINSVFTGNYAYGKNALAGAIYRSAGDLAIHATDGLSEFTGNYAVLNDGTVNNQGIYISGLTSTLTLDSTGTDGHLLMNDDIGGTVDGEEAYKVALTGDGVGKISLFGTPELADLSTTTANVTTADGNIKEYALTRMTTDGADSKWVIDADFANNEGDNFSTVRNSSGVVYIDDINVVADTTGRSKVQVLKTPTEDLHLQLNEDNFNIVDDIVDNLGDTTYNNVTYHQNEGYSLSTTDTTNDSIVRNVEHDCDALNLISSSTKNLSRTFQFASEDDYKVTENLQDSARGNLYINGTENGSTIDADGHSMFSLTDDTNLIITDTTIKNAKDGDIVNVAKEGVTINLVDSNIQGNLKGTENYNISVTGSKNSSITGEVTNANTTMTSGTFSFGENTFAADNDTVDFQGGNVALNNDVIENYIVNDLTSSSNANFTLDVDLTGKTADTITTNTTASSGTVTIYDVNYMNGNENVTDFEKQVLFNKDGNSNLQLAIADSASTYKIKDIHGQLTDKVNAVTNFNDAYYVREYDGELVGSLYVTTTTTENDTLGFKTTEVWDPQSAHIIGEVDDTLALVNQSDLSERTFKSENADDVYTVKADLGTTQGNLILEGVTGENSQSTVDLNGHDGFVLGEDANITVNDVTIKNGSTDDIITVTDSDSTVTLSGATIDGNIVGTADDKFNLNVSGQGNTTITGQVKNAEVAMSGGVLDISTDTFADDSTSISATAGTISTVNSQIEEYVFSDITSEDTAKYNIDIDLSDKKADVFVAEGSGTITLDSFNISGDVEGLDIGDTYKIQILKTSEDDLQIALSERVLSQLNNNYPMGSIEEYTGHDEVQAAMKWDDELYNHYHTLDVVGHFVLAQTDTTNDSIEITIKDFTESSTRDEAGDVLALWNQAEIAEDKTFTFDAADNVYNLTVDVGTTDAGKHSIVGVADTQGNKSTIDMNGHGGFAISKETEMTISDVKFTDINEVQGGLLNISNENAVVNLDNVDIDVQGQGTNLIANKGTVNMTGGEMEFNTGIVGNGTTNVDGADVTFTDGNSITQRNVNVDNGSLYMGTGSKINGNLSVGEDGDVTVDVGGINNAVTNDGDVTFKAQGDLNYNVTGDGTTHIEGDVVNKAKIDQDVDVKRGGKLDTHTDGLGGKINNDGDLILKGSIDDTITGAGKTTVNESLEMKPGAGVRGTLDLNNGAIDTSDNTISDYAIGKLENKGTFSIDVDGAAKTADKFTVSDAASDATIYIDDINLKNTSSVTEDFIAQVTSGSENVQVQLSDDIKAQDWQLGRTSRDEQDTVKAITEYDELYHTYVRGGDLYGNLVEAATNYNYDSIKMIIDETKTKWDANRTENGILGDTLALWNNLDTNVDKGFVFDQVDSYTWGSGATGAGDTHGTNVTLAGVSTGETTKATINFANKEGFNLVDATKFNINDMKLTGGGDIVTVKNGDASVSIKDSYIEGNITSVAPATTADAPKYNVAIAGDDTTTLRGTFTNADTTLSSGKLKFNTNTFADSNDTLTAAGGTVLLNNDTLEDYVINELTSSGDAKYVIDIDLNQKTADTIAVTSGTGFVTLDSLNFLGHASKDVVLDDTYIVQILKVADGDLQLKLSDEVQAALDAEPDSPYKIGESYEYTHDPLKQVTNWKDIYDHYQQRTDKYGTLTLATKDTTNDSIGVKYDNSRDVVNPKENLGPMGDTLMIVNTSDELPDKDFVFDTENDTYQLGDNVGQTSGTVNVKGVTTTTTDEETGETTTNTSAINFNGKSGFELADDAEKVTVSNTELVNASAEKGSVFNAETPDAKIELTNTNLKNNSATGEHGGAIYSKSDVDYVTDGYNTVIAGNNTNNGEDDEAIYMAGDSKLTMTTKNGGNLVITDKIASENGNTVALNGDETGNVYLTNAIDNSTVTMDEITLNLSSNDHFTNSDVVINSGTLNLINDSVQDQTARSFTVNGDFKVNADVDLKRQRMDRLPENTVVNNNAMIHVDKLNLLSDTKARKVAIPFAYYDFKGNVDYIGPKKLSKATQVTTAYAPIYKYKIGYEERDDMGYFVFGRGSGKHPGDFNPSVLVSPIATQIGGFLTQAETLQEGFYHMDRYTKYSSSDRMAAENLNKSAYTSGIADASRTSLPLTSQALWTKPYATFENVRLRGGVKVRNFAYGTFFGGDTDLIDMANGWKRITSAFIGYNGNHLSYNGVSMDMQGGALGMTETFYKGNFFTGITASVGASAGEAYTMYGTDRFAMLTAGVANKTGYNWELQGGKWIIQPSLFTGYMFVNNFDYTNAAGVKIDSDPLHAIQIIPGIKIIGNLKHGWQPYLGVNMVWNIMDKTHVMANDARLPQFSVKPFVEYGLGLQRSWNDRFTAYFQSMLRGGGRNGVVLTAGFRWIIGR